MWHVAVPYHLTIIVGSCLNIFWLFAEESSRTDHNICSRQESQGDRKIYSHDWKAARGAERDSEEINGSESWKFL